MTQSRILLVAEATALSSRIAQHLSAKGHTVELACDGASAVELAGSFAPELVFVQVGMARTCDLIKRVQRAIDGIPIVLFAVGQGAPGEISGA